MNKEIENLETQKMSMEEEFEEVKSSVAKLTVQFDEDEEELEDANKELESLKERELTLMADRATLDVNLRHLGMERRNLAETHS